MKAVLVIDMPKTCKECRIMENFGFVSDIKCIGRPFVEMFPNERQGRPNWCPLRPLPQKRINKDCLVIHEIWNEGWNACIDEITGEKDESRMDK